MDDFSYGTRSALTPSMVRKIKEAVGHKCEKCGSICDIEVLEVHHIEPVRDADGRYDYNSSSNLIVLCANCHKLAGSNKIPKIQLSDITYKRPEYLRGLLEKILADRRIVTSDTKTSMSSYGYPRVTSSPSSSSVSSRKTSSGSYSPSSGYGGMGFAGTALGGIVIIGLLLGMFYLAFGGLVSNWITPMVINFINPNSTALSLTNIVLWLIITFIKGSILIVCSLFIGYLLIFILKKLLQTKAEEINDGIISNQLDGSVKTLTNVEKFIYFFRSWNVDNLKKASLLIAVLCCIGFIFLLPDNTLNSISIIVTNGLSAFIFNSIMAVINFIVTVVVFVLTIVIIAGVALFMFALAKERSQY
ncbi:HNH endonuclease [Methanocella sp. MCL-LM]|uniref:HNH endonuclease n=1 Tax=Methanocella sp. MCL-LM TaxID=3412035 RepID=UPI003C76AF33